MSWWDEHKGDDPEVLPIRLFVNEYMMDALVDLRERFDPDAINHWVAGATEGNVTELSSAQANEFESVYRETIQQFIDEVR